MINAFTHERSIATHARLVWIEPGHDAGQGGTANRSCCVAPFIEKTLPCQLIEVGCFQVGVAHEAVVVPALVIAQDKYHVRLILRHYGNTAKDYIQK